MKNYFLLLYIIVFTSALNGVVPVNDLKEDELIYKFHNLLAQKHAEHEEYKKIALEIARNMQFFINGKKIDSELNTSWQDEFYNVVCDLDWVGISMRSNFNHYKK